MRIRTEDAPLTVLRSPVEEGNVYRNQQGRLYVVVALNQDRQKATALCVDTDGNIVNVVSYACYYFERFKVIGKATNLPSEIEIDWMD